MIAGVTAAHRAHCNYTEEATRDTVRRPAGQPPRTRSDSESSPGVVPATPAGSAGGSAGGSAAGSAPSSPDSLTSTIGLAQLDPAQRLRSTLWQQFASLLVPCVTRVVEFAKRVPGFLELSQDDQLILIKVGFLEVWLVHVSRLATEHGLTMWDGTTFTRSQLTTMYDADLVGSILSMCSSMGALGLSEPETALLCGAVLLSPDRTGLADVKAVRSYQDKVLDALRLQVSMTRPGETSLVGLLLQRLSELRALSGRHCSSLDWLRAHWTLLRLPPLFAEIFDIPKAEEDVA
ncbi:Ecdysone induced 78 [Frankliniella occidentalis]|nr:Ecdysone induced 78 [Frankliniella occidentalis]